MPDASASSGKLRHRIIEDFVVLWLDSDISVTNLEYQKGITQLQQIVSSISIFADPDQCVDFLTDIINEKVFLIVSDSLGYQLTPFIQDLSQLESMYVFCGGHKPKHNEWIKDFDKVKGIFNQIELICDALKRDIRQVNNSLISISIINSSSSSSSINLNELDQSFMYTQLLKDILLKMENDDKTKKNLVEYCRLQCADSNITLQIIDEFEQKYPNPSPIWWYTRECFTYYMINKALRTQDVEIIIKMGFFARDLHQQIERLYSESDNRVCFTVYRGQGMLNNEFTEMSKSKGGLLSFNNFLSTSTDRKIAQMFAASARENSDLTGVLFRMEIDPLISSAPFTSSDRIGYYSDTENEILFSMHTVFRIGEMKKIDDRLWEVHLKLTSDNDEQLTHLTEFIRETTDASTGLLRLGSLMFFMGEFNKAEEIFSALLETTSIDDWTGLASLHHMLGYVKYRKCDPSSALAYFKQSLNIELSHLPADNPKLCRNYSGIGLILKERGDLDGALEHFQRSLNIDLRISHPTQLNIATCYMNIGVVLGAQGKYDEALKSFERTLEIELVHLPPHHPSLATTYINIADTYNSLEDNLNALSYYKKALEIQRKSLPSNHPLLITLYSNIADIYDTLEDSSNALFYHEKVLEVEEKSGLTDHESLAISHHNIAMTLEELERIEEAVEHASQAVVLAHRAFGPNHPEVKENQEYLDELRQKL